MTQTDNVVRPDRFRAGGGGGPEDPMLEARVARLETDVHEIRADIREIKTDIKELNRRVGSLEERFARMEGGFDAMRAQIAALPTQWHFTVALVTSVLASGAVAVGVAALFVGMAQ
jgi:outer membrane murein-binding lipoprotein Lpp